jgi:hypothetical protein
MDCLPKASFSTAVNINKDGNAWVMSISDSRWQNSIKLGLPPKFHSLLMYHTHPNYYATRNYSRWLDLEWCFNSKKHLLAGTNLQEFHGLPDPVYFCIASPVGQVLFKL